MERSAILNKSMPSTAGATICSCALPFCGRLPPLREQSLSRRRTPFTTSRGSIPDGERFFQESVYPCSLFALIAHLSPQNLLTCHLIYQLLASLSLSNTRRINMQELVD